MAYRSVGIFDDDVHVTELPPHLRHRPARVHNEFAFVESRYQRPKSPTRAQEAPAPPQRPTATSKWNATESRYRSPQKDAAHSSPYNLQRQKPLAPHESVRETEEYKQHKRVAAAQGLKNVDSKYYELWHTAADKGPTPKDRVEQRLRELGEKKDGVAFKAWSTQAKTFSDMAKENAQMTRWNSPPAKSRGRSSVVMDWVKRGVPIPGRDDTPAQRPASPPKMGPKSYTAAGGAGGGSFNRRTNSPQKRGAQLEEQRVREVAASLKSARTSAKSPPRAANVSTPSITAKYTITHRPVSPDRRPPSPTQRGVSSATPTTQRGTSPTPRGASPTPRGGSPTRRPSPSPTPKPLAQTQRVSPTRRAAPADRQAATRREPNPDARHQTKHVDPVQRSPATQTPPPRSDDASDADVRFSAPAEVGDEPPQPVIVFRRPVA